MLSSLRAVCVGLLLAVALPLCSCQLLRQPANPPQFTDISSAAGLNYAFKSEAAFNGPKAPEATLTILETMGNGCAFLDYDNDGALDVLVVDRKLVLYKGDGKGHFTDVTHATSLDTLQGHFMGCAVGDYDNDGYEDLYISGFRTGLLLHNANGHGFKDVTKAAKLPLQRWSTSCGFVDVDQDGLLDLFVANYVDFGTDSMRYKQRCEPLACPPRTYNAEMPHLYRNNGNGTFTDISKTSGILDTKGKGLAVGFADYDDDGDIDIMVANDEVPCDLFENEGTGHFKNRAQEAGTALDITGKEQGGMGVDWADYDGDGRLDAIVSNYTDEPRSLYHNDGEGLFTNTTLKVGIGEATKPYLAFGVKWLDYDNDGWQDLIFANGNVDNHITVLQPDNSYPQPMQAFHNNGGSSASFSDVSKDLGSELSKPIVGRGLATGDFDNDGRVDVLVVDDVGPVRLLHNQGGKVGNWIGFSLTGSGKSNRDALGARVTVETADGHKQVREVQTASSYLSASDKRLLFGIGEAASVTKVTIRWPDGAKQELTNLAVGRYHAIRQGTPIR